MNVVLTSWPEARAEADAAGIEAAVHAAGLQFHTLTAPGSEASAPGPNSVVLGVATSELELHSSLLPGLPCTVVLAWNCHPDIPGVSSSELGWPQLHIGRAKAVSRLAVASCTQDTDLHQLVLQLIARMMGGPSTLARPDDLREEVVWHCNASGTAIGLVPRSLMRRDRLWHRATSVFITRASVHDPMDAQLAMQLRTVTKDYCPGAWDIVTGGVVAAGEGTDECAARELMEEMGIASKDALLSFAFMAPYADELASVHCAVYAAQWDGPMTPQESEVQRIEWCAARDILARVRAGEAFTPDSVAMLHLWIAWHEAGCPQPWMPTSDQLAAAAASVPKPRYTS